MFFFFLLKYVKVSRKGTSQTLAKPHHFLYFWRIIFLLTFFSIDSLNNPIGVLWKEGQTPPIVLHQLTICPRVIMCYFLEAENVVCHCIEARIYTLTLYSFVSSHFMMRQTPDPVHASVWYSDNFFLNSWRNVSC